APELPRARAYMLRAAAPSRRGARGFDQRAVSPSFRSNEAALGYLRLCETRSPRPHTRPSLKAATRWAHSTADPLLRNPIAGIAGCCACAARGHAAAALPSSVAKNFRRAMWLAM